ncbi:PAS-domain containing protein [Fluviibacterium sp. DFM31]|uniref:PAS-domain containing protein n=1 Tax=Meridianimarinicoccus marinus TaxID=3231483 RepID=A0ABV3L0Z2_9RHOB
MLNLTTLLASTVSCVVTGIAVYVLARKPGGAQVPPRPFLSDTRADDVVFLFRGRLLVDATDAARTQLRSTPVETDDLGRFVLTFSHRFEGIETALREATETDGFQLAEVPDDPDSLRLVGEVVDDCLRIRLDDPLRDSRSETLAHYSMAAMRAELFTLRTIAERSPIPTWKKRDDGLIIWANSSYMTLAQAVAGDEELSAWPPPDVFDSVPIPDLETVDLSPARISLATATDTEAWFDVIVLPGEIETLFFALPIDKLVRAENALTEFVQTLTKTFAHLPIGLAIFDKKRKLALFNPALVDLTGLPPDQLSSQPSLHGFLDALRDRQRIPEPKDYKSWRMKIAQLEADAADGTFEETWHLPSGQTYRVSGRPHPDGAVAYLFEDVSSEVSMTRSYRSEIALSHAVLDHLEAAVAVFSSAGVLKLTNQAYDDLWNNGLAPASSEIGIGEAIRDWAARSLSGAGLEAIRGLVLQSGDRSQIARPLILRDGTPLTCRAQPITGGSTLVTFDRTQDMARLPAVPTESEPGPPGQAAV